MEIWEPKLVNFLLKEMYVKEQASIYPSIHLLQKLATE